MKSLLLEQHANGVTHLILNRPQVHNAFDDVMIEELIHSLDQIQADEKTRVVVLSSQGQHFSAGADVNWMKRMATYSEAENHEDARRLGLLMKTLNQLNKPTVAKIHGAAFGGGVGLIACCDIAIASNEASFCFSEVKIGLIPAVISPYIINAIGERAARRYFLTAEKFSAEEGLRLGLLHKTVEPTALNSTTENMVQQLLLNSPAAQQEAKTLIRATNRGIIDAAMEEDTSRRIAHMRISPEGQEGLRAFLEKRHPSWILPIDKGMTKE